MPSPRHRRAVPTPGGSRARTSAPGGHPAPASIPGRVLRAHRVAAATALAALLALLAGPLAAQDGKAAGPCASDDHRAFDFWIGAWDVYNPAGRQVGRNEIRPAMGGCVLHESYATPTGFTGESFNAWDRVRGVWHQTWVDNTGSVLLLDGGREGDAMVLRGTSPTASGPESVDRITWTPLSGGRVRQHWERSPDGGESWTTVFDGEYRPRVEDTGGR